MGRDLHDPNNSNRPGEQNSGGRPTPPGGRGIPRRLGGPGSPGGPAAGGPPARPPLPRDGRTGATPRPDPGSRPPLRPGGPPPARPAGPPPGYGDPSRMPPRNGGFRQERHSGYGSPPAGDPPQRRSIADMARDASRSMSRSLGDLARDASRNVSRSFGDALARTGRAMRRDAQMMPPRQNESRYDSARIPASVPPPAAPPVPAPAPDPAAAMPLAMPRPASPNVVTKKLTSVGYRRSRIRLLAHKWRLARVRPNPVAYTLGVAATVFVVIGVVFGGGSGGIYAYSYYSSNVGKIQAVADLRLHANSIIYDRNGIPLYTAKGDDQYHTYVPLSQISGFVQDATIDTEDHTFYTNSGVDLFGTVRAALVDVRAGGASQGASTITQQLVKLLVLKNSEKVLTRKMHEAILAYGVTAQYSKAQILEMYLNQIDYGYPNQGIEAAATNYFGIQQTKNADNSVTTSNQQLQLWQAAILAGVPNGPTIYKPNVYSCDKAPCTQDKWANPFVNGCGSDYIPGFYGTATEDPWYVTHGHEWLVYCRAKLVLDHMVQYGSPIKGDIYTDAQERDALAKVRNALEQQTIRKGVNTAINGVTTDNKAPHFVQYVENILAEDFGVDHLESAGLRIYTTLDLDLNQYMQKRLHYYIDEPHADPWYPSGDCGGLDCPLKDYANAHNGAGVAIDQRTGDILGMVGSVDYTDKSRQVAGNVNVAVQKRSMGSATKPVVYATAFQMGWDPGIMLHDDVVCFPNDATNSDGTPFVTPDAPACKGHYVPHNDEPQYSGTFPIRYMLDNSLNVPATEAMAFVGSRAAAGDNFVSMAQRMGITTQNKAALGPATALGAQDMPLLELTSAYGTIANQGVHVPPRAVLEIDDAAGTVMWHAPANPYSYQAISPQAAYMVTNVLADDKARWSAFGSHNPLHLEGEYSNLAVAAKTGTSSGNSGPLDITTLGYSPYLTLGLWLGNDDNEPLSDIIGIKGPGFVFHDVMVWAAKTYKWDPNAQFPIPNGLGLAQFNCNTGLAPYKGSTSSTLVCDPMKPSWLPSNRWRNLYSGYAYPMDGKPRPDQDFFWQNAPPLGS